MFFESREIEDSLDEFCKIIDCRCTDITKRIIGERTYNIICDDEKLMTDEDPIVTLINPTCPGRNIHGVVIIVGAETLEGDLTGITDNDIDNIMSQMVGCKDTVDKKSPMRPIILIQ